MKKQILMTCLGAMMLVGTAAHAFTTEVITNVGGTGSPSGRFYFPVNDDVAVLTGFTGKFASADTQSTSYALLGVRSKLPFIGQTDIYGSFVLPGNSAQIDTEGTGQSVLRWVVVSKNWMYKLTDKISLGVSIPLIKFAANGSKAINVLDTITPQIGMNIDLF